MRFVPEEMGAEAVAELVRRRGLVVDAAEAERFRASLNSLLGRVRGLGDLIPRETAPPPNRAPE